VPAGVGIIAEVGALRRESLAMLAGLLVSTALGLAVTGLVIRQVSRVAGAGRPALPEATAE
jgi:holin-like protein